MAERVILFGNELVWGQQEHSVCIDGTYIEFSPTQYRLLLPLLRGGAVSYGELTRQVYHFDDMNTGATRRMLDKHMELIRQKMQGVPLRVYTIRSYGYILLPASHTGTKAG